MKPDEVTRLIREMEEHTLRGNIAEHRLRCWNNLTRAYVQLMCAYDGNTFKDELKKEYDRIAMLKSERSKKLNEILEISRREAGRLMDIYNERDVE